MFLNFRCWVLVCDCFSVFDDDILKSCYVKSNFRTVLTKRIEYRIDNHAALADGDVRNFVFFSSRRSLVAPSNARIYQWFPAFSASCIIFVECQKVISHLQDWRTKKIFLNKASVVKSGDTVCADAIETVTLRLGVRGAVRYGNGHRNNKSHNRQVECLQCICWDVLKVNKITIAVLSLSWNLKVT